jgi:hypothetical protein
MKAVFFLLSFFILTTAMAQSTAQPTDERSVKRDSTLWEDEKALDAMTAIMSGRPKTGRKAERHFNAGVQQFNRQAYNEAAITFKEILAMDYDEMAANNIMEPFKLYKHRSAWFLAEISLRVKNWEEAERYIYIFDKKYPYRHFCGNELSAYRVMKATMDARLHEGQGKIDQSVRDLVPYIFDDVFASNVTALSLLRQILRSNYSIDEVRTELVQGIGTMKVDTAKMQAVLVVFDTEASINGYFISKQHGNFGDEARMIVRANPLFIEFLEE